MDIKIPRLALACSLSLLAVTNMQASAQSLESVVAKSLDTHPEIRQLYAQFKVREEEVEKAEAGYLPTVDLTAGIGYEYLDSPGNRRILGEDNGETELTRRELGLSIRQMLFDGMFTSSEIDRTYYEASADRWTLLSKAENIALEVSKVYLNYLKAEQILELTERNIQSHQEIYNQIKERTDSGIGNIADLSQVTGRLARAQSNMISAKNNLLDARAQFIRVTNVQPKDLIMPVPDADMLPKNKYLGLTSAVENHPVIKSAQQDIYAAQAFSESVDAVYYPQVSLEVDARMDDNITGDDGFNQFGPDVGGDRDNLQVMLRVRYNLFNGGRDTAEERSAAYKVMDAKEINADAHRQVREGFELAWNAYEMLELQKQYIQQHVTTSYDTKVAYKEQFSLGQRNLLDLLDTENELFEARRDYLEADTNETIAKYRLLNVTGKLLDSMRVTRSETWQGEQDYSEGANND